MSTTPKPSPDFVELATDFTKAHVRFLHEAETSTIKFRARLAEELSQAFESGAAVAFGLMGMAEAIRANGPRLVERDYWTTESGERLYTCFCPGCGAYMKHRKAGQDEGTDNEWCGACRY